MKPPLTLEQSRSVFFSLFLMAGTIMTTTGADPADASTATMRQDLAQVLDVYEAIGTQYNMDDVRTTAAGARRQLMQATDDALIPLSRSEASITRLRELSGHIALSILSPTEPSAPLSPGLPEAPYSGLCGSLRTDTDVLFASQEALFVSETIREEASRICDEVVVLLGEGGNTSLLCIVSDAIFIVAKGVHQALVFCEENIDSAEIVGSYRRLSHVHEDLADHVAQLAQHDREMNERLDQIDQALADIICLLKTPEGRRPGWNEGCEISGALAMLPTPNGTLEEAAEKASETGQSASAQAAIPAHCELGPIVPNPFNPTTTVHFAVARAGHVTLGVYDANGRLARLLVDAALSRGYHQIEFDGRGLASGTYIARLVTPEGTLNSKLLLLK